MNETEILKNIASFIKDNPNSDIKEKIETLLSGKDEISFIEAVDMMNHIRKILDIPSEPVPVPDFCKIFTKSFNDTIKINIGDCFIHTPIFFESKVIKMLNEILEEISYEKYYILKKYLESKGCALIDIEAIIRSANKKLKDSNRR